jgi:hypothetical protein
MSYRKHGAALLGALAMAVLGVTVFAATTQALTPKFLVGKGAVVAGLNALLEGAQIGRETLSVPALNIEFNCEKTTVSEGLIVSGTEAKGALVFEECTVLELKAPLGELPCNVKNKKIAGKGTVIPAELKNGEPAILVSKGEALIGLESGTGCPLPLDNIVTGDLCVKIETNDTVKPVGSTSQTIQAECRARSSLGGPEISGTPAEIEKLEKEGKAFLDEEKYGTQQSFVTGKGEVFLGGVHKGLTLGVSLQ